MKHPNFDCYNSYLENFTDKLSGQFFLQKIGSCLVKKHTYMAIKQTQFKGDILEIRNSYIIVNFQFASSLLNISAKKST